MYSAENEEVALKPSIYPHGNVENWLNQVEFAMRNTLREIIGEALRIVDLTPRKEWVYMWPGQVTLCCGQTSWTAQVENGITTNTLSNYFGIMLSHVSGLLFLFLEFKIRYMDLYTLCTSALSSKI